MEKYSLRQDFYERVRNDYYMHRDSIGNDSVENAFIFQYMEHKVQSNRGKNFRQNLEDNWEALKNGKTSKFQYVKFIVERLSQSPKLYQNCDDKDKNLLIPLLAYNLNLKDTEINELKRNGRKKDIHSKLLSLNHQIAESDRIVKKRIDEIPMELLEYLTDRLQKIAVHIEVKTFFYDAGYPVYNVKTDTEYEREKKGTGRKQKSEGILNILDEFCASKELALSDIKPELKEEEYEEFFRILAAGGNEDLFIPLQIDSISGCGLFIVGKRYVWDGAIEDLKGEKGKDLLNKKRQREDGTTVDDLSCLYVVSNLLLEDFDMEYQGIPYTLEDTDYYITYHEAKSLFDNRCTHGRLLESQLRKYNNQWPGGIECPPSLRRYFAEARHIRSKKQEIPSPLMKHVKQVIVETAKKTNKK